MIAATMDPVLAVGVRPTTSRLRAALRANAVFCLLCGAVLAGAGWRVAQPWRLGSPPVPAAAGAVVAGFGLLLAWLAVQPARRMRRWAPLVTAADALWVAGSVVLLLAQLLPQPVAVAAVAAAVAVVAAGQVAGLTIVRGDDPLADVEVVESTRVLAVPPARMWPLLTDHDLYGRLAPNLTTVEVISGAGQPLRRRCTNTAGHGWEEACTVWEDGRRFAVDVDITDYPYPILSMRGLWQVDLHPAGSRVTVRFAYRARPTIRGGLFAIGVRLLSPPIVGRIFAGWQVLLTASANPVGPRADGRPSDVG